MKQYINVLQKILDEGVEKESGRANMPNTIGISKADISMDLSKGFPLLTTKKMYWKGIVHELLWFLRGETNIKYLVDNNVNIWNSDAYRWYLKYCKIYSHDPMEMDIFVLAIKQLNDTGITQNGCGRGENKFFKHVNSEYRVGDLGKVYGHQWRNQNGVDQISDVVEGLKKNPYSRYHIIDGWNKADFPEMALPPCHLLYQFIVRPLSLDEREEYYNEKMVLYQEFFHTKNSGFNNEELDSFNVPKFYLDLNMYQRSCDIFLGVPFNIASMSLLLTIIAKASGMIAGVTNWIGGDTHMYVSHLDAVKEQLSRAPTELPTISINKDIKTLEDICNLTIDDIELIDYVPQDKIKAELFTGLKKK